MSWASHPTSEMPPSLVNPTRHRRRRASIIGITAAAVLLGLAVGGVMLSPTLFGWPPSAAPAGQALASAGPSSARVWSPSPSSSGSTTPTSTLATATTQTSPTAAAKVTASKRSVTTAAAAPGIPALEDEVLRLTNLQRASHGCAALRMDTALHTAARDHSAEMAGQQTLTHTGLDGSSPGDRMKKAGYNTDKGWAENVAAGYPTPDAVMTGWMNSEGHRANILNCSLKAIGVGVARASNSQLYWTQDFGGR